jgi:hypothetical protein
MSADVNEMASCAFYKNVMTTRIVRAFHIIPKNDLGAWVTGVAPITQVLCHVLNILMAAPQLILAACVVDADEKRLAHHDESI